MRAIFERKSIRKYTDEIIPLEDIKELVRAAMAAPSAGNSQPWEFVIIDDKELMNKVTEIHKYSQMLPKASHGILVCATPNRELFQGYWPQDCAAATENILIKAQDMGFGAVWLGIYPEEDRVNGLREIFNIPENIIPFSLISVGYPNEKREQEVRYDEERISINLYGNR